MARNYDEGWPYVLGEFDTKVTELGKGSAQA